MSFDMIRIEAVSEDGLIIYLADQISEQAAGFIGAASVHLRQHSEQWLTEIIPSYTSILVQYDLSQLDFIEARHRINALLESFDYDPLSAVSRLIELPACYHPDVAPDLLPAAENLALSVDRLIDIHCSHEYRVCAIGFSPGFAFLAKVDPQIVLPRKASPRKKVMAGSVGIADAQTAVYPGDSPGGWQIIGNCPIPLFYPDKRPMTPFRVGDRVQFSPITYAQYQRLGGKDWNGD